jgi:hypothetical protein
MGNASWRAGQISKRVALPQLTYSASNEQTVGYRDKPPWSHGGFFRRITSSRNHFRRRFAPGLSHSFRCATPGRRRQIVLRAPKSRTLCRALCLGLTIGRLRRSETDTAVLVSQGRSQLGAIIGPVNLLIHQHFCRHPWQSPAVQQHSLCRTVLRGSRP